MKVINSTIFKSVLAVLTALVGAQAGAYPFRVTKLTRGEGKDKITIYNLWDIHPEGSMDQNNANYCVHLANKTKALVLLEDPFSEHISKNPDISATLQYTMEGYDKSLSEN